MSKYTDTLLVSPSDVKAGSYIDYNVSDGMIGPAIRTAQDTYLREIIGDALLDKLMQLEYNAIIHEDPSMDSMEEYKYLLETYVQPYLIAKTQVEILLPISLEIRNAGVVQKYDTNIQAAQLSNISRLRKYYETQAIDKANRMVTYLNEAKDLFPELKCTCNNGLKLRANTGLHI